MTKEESTVMTKEEKEKIAVHQEQAEQMDHYFEGHRPFDSAQARKARQRAEELLRQHAEKTGADDPRVGDGGY